MKDKKYWIDRLCLTAHSEGGYFYQTYVKNTMSSIYFLLTQESPSHFHRLKSDEIWYYHYGETITIHMILPSGEYQAVKLGLEDGAFLQYTVVAGTIFGSSVDHCRNCDFSVVGCAVTPAFSYDEFELFTQDQLLSLYPQHKQIIKRLAYE